MARVKTELPGIMREHWVWVIFLDAWDHGDCRPLADLISEQTIPDLLKPAIAKRISGERTPNLKAAKKLKIPATRRMEIAERLNRELYIGQIDADIAQHFSKDIGITRKNITREYQDRYWNLVSEIQEEYEVSEDTVLALLKEFRQKIKDWPDI